MGRKRTKGRGNEEKESGGGGQREEIIGGEVRQRGEKERGGGGGVERKRKRWPCDVENGGGALAARDGERACVRARISLCVRVGV